MTIFYEVIIFLTEVKNDTTIGKALIQLQNQ